MSWDSSKGHAHTINEIEEVRADNSNAGHGVGAEDEQERKVEVDMTEEHALVRKLDRRILPITCILYLFACTTFIVFLLLALRPALNATIIFFTFSPFFDRP
jgi:hypothetical protein